MTDFIFLDSKITVNSDCSHEIERHLFLGRKAMINLDSVLKSKDITLLTKSPYSQSYGFSHPCVDVKDKEVWVLKNWCFQTIVLEETLESPLDSKKIKPVNPKGNQSWIFIGRTDAEAPILWPLDVKKPSLEKTLIMGKTKGKRRRVRQRVRWLHSITDSINMNQSKLQEIIKDREAFTGMLSAMGRKFLSPKT